MKMKVFDLLRCPVVHIAADDSDYLVSMKLAELVLQTPVGHILESISEDADELYRYYLHDFVKYVHRCKHVDEKSESQEYQVVMCSLFWVVWSLNIHIFR